MAKITGIPPFTGTVGDTTIYKLGDQYVARKKADYGIKQIMRNPKCQFQRENMQGFGFSSSISRQLRKAWGTMGKIAIEATTGPRLTPIIYEMQKRGQGLRGTQSIEISKFGHKLEGFTLAKGRSPQAHFTHTPVWQIISPAKSHTPGNHQPNTPSITQYTISVLTGKIVHQTAPELNTITDPLPILQLKFPEGTRHIPVKAPAKAKYYAIRLQLTAISDQHWSEKQGEFIPEHGIDSTLAAHTISQYYQIAKKPGVLDTLEIPISEVIKPGQNLLITWGIEYFSEENGQPEPIVISKPRSKCRQTECSFEVIAVTQHEAYPQKAIHTQKENTKPKRHNHVARSKDTLRPGITSHSNPTPRKNPNYSQPPQAVTLTKGQNPVRQKNHQREPRDPQPIPTPYNEPDHKTQTRQVIHSQSAQPRQICNNQKFMIINLTPDRFAYYKSMGNNMLAMDPKDFETVETKLKEAISLNDKSLVAEFYEMLRGYDEPFMNTMPEYIYGRYLECLKMATTMLSNP